jgi:hypothetical protein
VLYLNNLWQQGTTAATPWDAVAALGGTGLAGLMFYWLQDRIKRHETDLKVRDDQHSADYKAVIDRQAKQDERFIAVQERQTQALNELTNAIQQLANLDRLEEKIERLRDERTPDKR